MTENSGCGVVYVDRSVDVAQAPRLTWPTLWPWRTEWNVMLAMNNVRPGGKELGAAATMPTPPYAVVRAANALWDAKVFAPGSKGAQWLYTVLSYVAPSELTSSTTRWAVERGLTSPKRLQDEARQASKLLRQGRAYVSGIQEHMNTVCDYLDGLGQPVAPSGATPTPTAPDSGRRPVDLGKGMDDAMDTGQPTRPTVADVRRAFEDWLRTGGCTDRDFQQVPSHDMFGPAYVYQDPVVESLWSTWVRAVRLSMQQAKKGAGPCVQ